MTEKTGRIIGALLLSSVLLGTAAISIAQNKRTYRRINFARGSTTAVVKGTLPADGFHYYYLRARGGQTLSARITSTKGTAVFTIMGRQSDKLLGDAAGVTDWTGELPRTEDYELHVGARGGGSDRYTLEVTIR